MSLVIPDEFFQTAQIFEADLKLEIAILLFRQEKIALSAASQFLGVDKLEFQRILSSHKISTHDHAEDFQQDLRTLETKGSELEQTQPTQTEILQRIEQRRTFTPTQNNLPDILTLLQEDRTR
jgi:predicted HTH domain antitoxin